MELRRFTISLALVFVFASLNTGCFGLFGGGGADESAMITVVNDLDPTETRTIQIRRGGDDETTLGTVPGNAERMLTYEAEDLQGTYQLVARQSSGAAVVSREFTLFAGARVRWQMRTNSVTVSQ